MRRKGPSPAAGYLPGTEYGFELDSLGFTDGGPPWAKLDWSEIWFSYIVAMVDGDRILAPVIGDALSLMRVARISGK